MEPSVSPRFIFPVEPTYETQQYAEFTSRISNWSVCAFFLLTLGAIVTVFLRSLLKKPREAETFLSKLQSSPRRVPSTDSIVSPLQPRWSGDKNNRPRHFKSRPSPRRRADVISHNSGRLSADVEIGQLYRVETYYREHEYIDSIAAEKFILCIIGATSAVGATLIVPITITSHQILVNYPNNWYVQWLRTDLISGIWDVIFFMSLASILVLLPFGHFFEESVGFGQPPNWRRKNSRVVHYFRRIIEALVSLTLLIAILSGIVFVLYRLAAEEEKTWLQFAYSIISTCGSVVFVVCTPLGFTSLTRLGFSLSRPFVTSKGLKLKRESLSIETQHLEIQLDPLADSAEEWRRLEELRRQLSEAEKATVKGTIFWNGISLSLISINIVFPTVIVLKVFFHLANSFIRGERLYNFAHMEETTYSYLHFFILYLETASVGYSIAAALLGLYQLNWMKKIQPKRGETTVRRLTLNVGVVLVLSSAFPIIFRVLGLTSFDLIGLYRQANHSANQMLHLIMRASFIMTLTRQFVVLFPPTRYVYNGVFRIIWAALKFSWWIVERAVEIIWKFETKSS
ncbi:hypothetical protein PROFUN_04515 [Planoprotostelium fungivorum]|uniref:Uncharacterized protein n=1 Tax=Planoprotostelium fungivorum TaxID=1890364 RepID=A0A2P6NBF1_9EUKA|nr:hypothetical protein PROFUN_04515 [Planoprotostelium fungivorum]